MVFRDTALPGAYVLEVERKEDARGFFARTFCRDEFMRHGLPTDFVQSSVSFNPRRGTLRGMHFQRPPRAEGKIVRCTSGVMYDVVLDLREDSRTFLRWMAVELSADTRRAVYVPPGCAHGFQTLTEDVEVLYSMTEPYVPELAGGVRWDDPAFAIHWPIAPPILSDRDATFPSFVR